MVKVKLTKKLLYEGFQYGEGDIVVVSEGNALHLYGMGDAEPHTGNLNREGFGLPKENDFSNVHEKQI